MARTPTRTPALNSVVLDTNVLVSALVFGGIPRQILEKTRRLFVLCVSTELLAEIAIVLQRPKFIGKAALTPNDIATFVRRLRQIGRFVYPLDQVPIFAPDPKDTHLLACAKTVAADYLVTGDAALLRLKRYHGTKIVTPRAFLTVLEQNA